MSMQQVSDADFTRDPKLRRRILMVHLYRLSVLSEIISYDVHLKWLKEMAVGSDLRNDLNYLCEIGWISMETSATGDVVSVVMSDKAMDSCTTLLFSVVDSVLMRGKV